MTVGEDTPHSIATRLRTASLEDHNCGNIFDGEKEPRCAKRGSKFRGKAGPKRSYKKCSGLPAFRVSSLERSPAARLCPASPHRAPGQQAPSPAPATACSRQASDDA